MFSFLRLQFYLLKSLLINIEKKDEKYLQDDRFGASSYKSKVW